MTTQKARPNSKTPPNIVNKNPWHVRLSPEFVSHETTPLSERAKFFMITLEYVARTDPFSWMGNEHLTRLSGHKTSTLSELFRELQRAGWISCVYRDRAKRHRVGIIMLRRTSSDDKILVADTPKRLAEARQALLDGWGPKHPDQSYRWGESGISDAGNPATVDAGFPAQNNDASLELDGMKEDEFLSERASPLAVETTLLNRSSGGEKINAEVRATIENLQARLDEIMVPGLAAGDARKKRVRGCVAWLVSSLGDYESHGYHYSLIFRMIAEEFTAAVIIEAFTAAIMVPEDEIGVRGAFFATTINNILARKVSDQELLDEHAVFPMRPMAPADLDTAPTRTAAKPEAILKPGWASDGTSDRVAEVQGQVLAVLEDIAADGPIAGEDRLSKSAKAIQELLGGCHLGGPSKRFRALTEAVAQGFPIAKVEQHFSGRIRQQGPPTITDLRGYFMDDLDTLIWLKHNVPQDSRVFGFGRRTPERKSAKV